MVRLNDAVEQQLTFGDVSYVEPDLQASGKLVASRVRSQVDIWKFPIAGTPEENTRKGIRMTQQTGQVQTPSISPDGQEMVYLSDSGGHGNLWIAKTDGSAARQITFEQDPAVAVGVPVWSPAGNQIVFILTRNGRTAQWLVHPDGSGLRQLIPAGIWAYWSADGRWVYYVVTRNGVYYIEKVPVEGGAPVVVRSDNAVAPAAVDGSLLYYATFLRRENRWWDFEFRRARPESGNYDVLARIAGTRVPHEALNFHMILSPDGKWLVTPLTNGTTTNLWLLPAGGGAMRQVTDFGKRATLIVRRVSWSPDSKQLYAAVAECDTDIVMLNGIVP
jgi:Tol biopolymer transport system component